MTYGRIREARSDNGSQFLASAYVGYGGKIPTRYRIRLDGDSPTGRWRRVYAACFGNSATFYVVVNGEDVILPEVDLGCALDDSQARTA